MTSSGGADSLYMTCVPAGVSKCYAWPDHRFRARRVVVVVVEGMWSATTWKSCPSRQTAD